MKSIERRIKKLEQQQRNDRSKKRLSLEQKIELNEFISNLQRLSFRDYKSIIEEALHTAAISDKGSL